MRNRPTTQAQDMASELWMLTYIRQQSVLARSILQELREYCPEEFMKGKRKGINKTLRKSVRALAELEELTGAASKRIILEDARRIDVESAASSGRYDCKGLPMRDRDVGEEEEEEDIDYGTEVKYNPKDGRYSTVNP